MKFRSRHVDQVPEQDAGITTLQIRASILPAYTHQWIGTTLFIQWYSNVYRTLCLYGFLPGQGQVGGQRPVVSGEYPCVSPYK